MNKDMNPNAKLNFLERFGYGVGDYSANLIYASISAFLLLYYTNVVGASAAMAASIIAISKIFDGISDLIMGVIVDRTHSKYGKARPWILRLCVPFAIASVLMFSVPNSLSGKGLFIYANMPSRHALLRRSCLTAQTMHESLFISYFLLNPC